MNRTQHSWIYSLLNLCVVLGLLIGLGACSKKEREARVLVFSKTAGYRHASIPEGIKAIQELGKQHNFQVDTTEDASLFTEKNLKQYSAVVFLNTTGDVLNYNQQADFERYIQAGGGYVGIHAATDTEYGWPWYNKLAGAYFESHPNNPNVQKGIFNVVDRTHPATDSLPEKWEHTDEFYSFKSMNPEVKVLMTIDEKSYQGGTNGDNHPMAWYHEFDGGRAFYTSVGHTNESFSDPLVRRHILGGIQYVMGEREPLNYQLVKTERLPDESRFEREKLFSGLNEPIAMDIFKDGRVIFIERKGEVYMYHPDNKQVKQIAKFPVFWEKYTSGRGAEDGLLGVALDPKFEQNKWVYFFYSPLTGNPSHTLYRYKMEGDSILMATEQKILEVPTQRDECCHTGGAIAFDKEGNLFVSTGDNTNPFSSNGYSPSDERPGRSAWDAQKSSANPNDLRGKILRIKVQEDGSYTIPEGNLFPKGEALTRPEIYVMGNRNPYKISVDQKTGYLYWGEVGPDARDDKENRGPRGYDEVNQARKAGNFGWPHFVGPNYAYNRFNFADSTSGEKFDPAKPINNSPYNTGKKELPPAQKAFIWYPYADSPEFPIVNKGGSSRNAMAGPVFYSDMYRKTDGTFPDYYNGKLFVYDWMRGWVLVATMDEKGDLVRLEPFMESVKFANPMDMKFGPDGTLYVLEYGGPTWFGKNENSGLTAIRYNGGNRTPVVQIAADKKTGATPLIVNFSSKGTFDYDEEDELKYEWKFNDKGATSNNPNPSFVFQEPGVYTPTLTVTDKSGASATAQIEVKVGNEQPQIAIELAGNQTFFWENKPIEYEVKVSDKEDGKLGEGKIAPAEVFVSFDYLPEGFDRTQVAVGHEALMAASSKMAGQNLINNSDCRSCHANETESIGPAYIAVAKKYKGSERAVSQLAQKIIRGGAGVWGEQAMPAHPQLAESDAKQMVNYILSLADEKKETKTAQLAPKGTLNPKKQAGATNEGMYILQAAYTDKGGSGVGPLTAQEAIALRHPQVKANTADKKAGANPFKVNGVEYMVANHNGHLMFENIDLTGIEQLVINGAANSQYTVGGKIEVRTGSPSGDLIGEVQVQAGEGNVQVFEVAVPLKNAKAGKQDLYFVFKNDKAGDKPLFALDWIYFQTKNGKSLALK